MRMVIATVVGWFGGWLFAGQLNAIGPQSGEIAKIIADGTIKQNIDTLLIQVTLISGKGSITGLASAGANAAANLAFALIDKVPKIINGWTHQINQN